MKKETKIKITRFTGWCEIIIGILILIIDIIVNDIWVFTFGSFLIFIGLIFIVFPRYISGLIDYFRTTNK